MKIHDISQEVFSCRVYPGDPAPCKKTLSSMQDGALYNLTAFSMCAHNGTHIDAPRHFIADGGAVDEMPLENTVGEAFVCAFDGDMDAEGARTVLARAGGIPRILLKGTAVVSPGAAEEFAAAGVRLIASEGQSVGDENAPMAVHKILLSAGVALLEGVRLDGAPEGRYLLCAQPLKLKGADGAPCRALLIEMQKGE